MGHNTENLVGEADLNLFKGIILSPLNRSPLELHKNIISFRKKGNYDIVFDPQLYFPRANKGLLKEHPYFPKDFETADYSSLSWWIQLISNLIPYINVLDVDSVCSPIVYAKSWKEDYYKLSVEIKDHLFTVLKKISPNKKCFLTIVINVNDLSDPEKIMKTATIVSSTNSDGFYVVFVNDLLPRREIKNTDDLLGMMKFISELKHTGKPIIVTHTASDMILYKYAGADHCATGKYFNLRRFSQSRFNETGEGGNQLPYWFEPNLLGFIRETDLVRILKEKPEIITSVDFKNKWSSIILNNISLTQPTSWIKYGWRQYLSVFGQIEQKIDFDRNFTELLLHNARNNWSTLNSKNIFMDEKNNDGSWAESWLGVIQEFKKYVAY